jgi:hypothetical protein
MPATPPPVPKAIQHPGTYPKPPRRAVPQLDVWSPEGVKETHDHNNARDLVRSCGYTLHNPGIVAADVPPENEEFRSPEIGGVPGMDEAPNPTLDALNALRARAEGLGITVDNRWGTRRLNELIAEAEAAKPEEAVTDDAGE